MYFDGTSGKFSFKPGAMDKNGVAYGYYNNTLNATGWGILEIKADCRNRCNNSVAMYAAGFLEGIFTARSVTSFN